MQPNDIPDNKITAAGVLVISSDNKILAFARGGDLTKLGLPAGKRESNESLKQNAARELFEETGFMTEITDTDEVFIYQPDDKHAANVEEYCATFIKRINLPSETFVIQAANLDAEGNPEGHGLWVEPSEFIAKGSSAFIDYNTNLLRFAKLVD